MTGHSSPEREWAKRFADMDELFLEHVWRIWPCVVHALNDEAHENAISMQLVKFLSKDQSFRNLFHWIEFEFVPFDEVSGEELELKGYIDIALFLDWDRERYLAYECKRLNIGRRTIDWESLAGEYVKEGVMRYVNEKYAQNLPLGGMLGFVMDGEIKAAKAKITKAIQNGKNGDTLLKSGPSDIDPIGGISRMKTIHTRRGRKRFEIRHALLPFRINS